MLVKVHWDRRKCTSMLPGPPRSQDFQKLLQRMKNDVRKAGVDILLRSKFIIAVLGGRAGVLVVLPQGRLRLR